MKSMPATNHHYNVNDCPKGMINNECMLIEELISQKKTANDETNATLLNTYEYKFERNIREIFHLYLFLVYFYNNYTYEFREQSLILLCLNKECVNIFSQNFFHFIKFSKAHSIYREISVLYIITLFIILIIYRFYKEKTIHK